MNQISHVVFVDFHNADEQGRLRLNCVGTIEDLAQQQAGLRGVAECRDESSGEPPVVW
jgi:hypothetical protein